MSLSLAGLAVDLLIKMAGAFSTEAGKAAFARLRQAVAGWAGADVDPTDPKNRQAVETRIDRLDPATKAELAAMVQDLISASKPDPSATVRIGDVETVEAEFRNIVAGDGRAMDIGTIRSQRFTVDGAFGDRGSDSSKKN